MKRFSLKKEKDISMQKSNSKKYIKDNIFDNFDISDLIKKDLLIPKTDLENFIYEQDIHNSNLSSSSTDDISQLDKTKEEIIQEINNTNSFNISLEKLILTYKNGYEIPFIEEYTPIKIIGQGHFGLALSVKNNATNQKMAVKIIKKKNFSDEYYLSETKILNKLNHERIIKLYDVVNTQNYLFIFTELCSGGSLKDYIISKYNSNVNYFMKDSEVSLIIKNIMEGVGYLANNGIIHRDLKPENIMFRKENDINSLVLCDFGLAKENIGNSFLENKCGTLIFMAPEVIMRRPYDSLVDIWSIGIIMYILESGGRHPFYNSAMRSRKFIDLINEKSQINFPDSFPEIARNFFLKLCKYEPFFRYDINRALNHPWIARINQRIPLTVIEDIEKENKIKSFKNMLSSIICLKQMKIFFRKKYKNKTLEAIKTKSSLIYKYKLMSPIVKMNKEFIHFSSQKEIKKIGEEFSTDNIINLPLIKNSLSPKVQAQNNLPNQKSIKNINFLNHHIKPQNLFSQWKKDTNLNKLKYQLNLSKPKVIKNRRRFESFDKCIIYDDVNLEKSNSINKYNFPSNKNINYLKNGPKKFRLYSSIKINFRNMSKN